MRDHHHYLFFSDNIIEHRVTLSPSETRHAVKALRLKDGDRLLVTDGKGNVFTCISNGTEDSCLTGIIETTRAAQPDKCKIRLFTGIPEKDSFESMLVNCTALGITSLTPVINDYSQEKWWDGSWEKLQERFRNKMVSAMKQSLYPFLPVLGKPVSLDNALETPSNAVLVADPEGKSITALPQIAEITDVNCFVGPPGGYSPRETTLFRNAGVYFVKLTEQSRLRTELASEVLCAQVIGLTI